MKKNLKFFNFFTLTVLVVTIFSMIVLPIDIIGQNGNRHYDTDPSALTISPTTPNDVKIKDMVAINENGYVFWDWVYKSSDVNQPSIFNETVRTSFRTTFPKIRLFHIINKDYNEGTPSVTTISPCTQSGVDPFRTGMCANRDFYSALRPDYDFIASSSTTAIFDGNHGFPNGWYSGSEWGGSNAKQKAYEYALAFLQTMDPSPANSNAEPLVNRFYSSNEIWGTTVSSIVYKDILDGFIEGFAEHYQNNRLATPDPSLWKIKMWLGAFQAHRTATVWGGDYIGDKISNKSMLALEGIDIHPYSFEQDAPNNSSALLTEHPESTISYFQSIKNMVDWRDNHSDNNVNNFKISATEFGWNDENALGSRSYIEVNCGDILPACNCDCNAQELAAGKKGFWVMNDSNGNPSTSPNNSQNWNYIPNGVGQESQAIYTVRAYLMMARLGLESAYIYAATNNDESTFSNCGVYDSDLYIQQVNAQGNFLASNFAGIPGIGDFTSEKLIMPAMRKLQNTSIIGDKKYLQALSEVDNGAYAYLLGDGAGNPTHLVAWYAKKTNNQNEGQINGSTIPVSLTSIGFPSNLSLATNVSGYTRLDWNENNTNNISVSSIYDGNNTLTLSPTPIVIPLGGGGGNPITFVDCPANISVTAGQTVSWTAPDANTTCVVPSGCGTPPTLSGFTSYGENGTSYFYRSNGTKSWSAARADCIANNGELADFHSQTEFDFVRDQIVNEGLSEQIFIGMFQEDNSSTWEWTSGAAVTYTNWIGGQPNTTGQASTLITWSTPTFQWANQNKGAWKKYILEVPCGGSGSGPADVTILGPDVVDSNNNPVSYTSGTAWPVGTYTVTYTGTDPCGNSETCSFTVTVNAAPETCSDNIQNQNETGVDCGGVCPACPSGGKDLQVTISASPTSTSLWNEITFEVKVKNVGTEAINSSFIVENIVPPGMKQVGGNPPSVTSGSIATWCSSGPCWEWTLPSLAIGVEETLTLPLFQTAAGNFNVTAQLQDPVGIGDTNSSNNSDVVAVSVSGGSLISNNTGLPNASNQASHTESANVILDEDIKLFPNPASNILYVQLKNDYGTTGSIEVYNSLGQNVIRRNHTLNSAPIEVKVDDLESGVYTILVRVDNLKKYVKRFIVH